jgi:hypothetical protein
MVRASPVSVTTWRLRYDLCGPAPKLDGDRVTVRLALLAEGAAALGYANDLSTLDRVDAWVCKMLGVSCDPYGVCHLLRRAKCSA